jgi:hypothetical protein
MIKEIEDKVKIDESKELEIIKSKDVEKSNTVDEVIKIEEEKKEDIKPQET